jgi:hypothetical protein
MSKRDTFLLRIDPGVLEDLKQWAESELRSTNAHIEYLLRKCLLDAGRHSHSAFNKEVPDQGNSEED